jgi:sugar transferase EpsL
VRAPVKRSTGIVKRLVDIAAASVLLVFLGPLLMVVCLGIRIALGSPVFFRQTRPGLNGVPFVLYKFRTMKDLRDGDGNLLTDEQRMTGMGSWLRRASLDELPELWNVLKGDMSMVGPRPLLMQYLDRYTAEQRRRHEVRPGITGWAQVNGRNAIAWEEKFAFDVWYVDHCSFRLDCTILFLTLRKTMAREGINQPGQVTMEEFMGSPPRSSADGREARE